MKAKRREWLQSITASIGVAAFIYMLGQAGYSDLNKITYDQVIIRCTISVLVMLSALFTYWKIGQADEY